MIFLRYELIGKSNIDNPVETFLENREVDRKLFKIGEEVVLDYNLLDNIQAGIDILLKNIDKKICVIVDPDCDGYTSSALLWNKLKEEYPDVDLSYKIHTGKQHGLTKDIVIEDFSLVVLPDSGSNDYKQHEELVNRGIDVLVLDHHEADGGYSKFAVTINNQLSEYPNKQLSGVGIVYKFLCALDEYNFTDGSDKYLDLVALGNIADMMNMKSEESRYLAKKGLKNINNTFLQALVDENEYDLDGKMNFEKIGWTIAPKLNGTIRSGNMLEKEQMFKAFISDDYDFCLETAKMCKNIKAKQDRQVKAAMTQLDKSVKFTKIGKCLIVDTGKVNASFRGLVASKLVDKYGVPCLLYSDKGGGLVGGSFRGCSFTDNLRDDLLKCPVVTMAQGHGNAGGWEVKKDDLGALEDFLNELYKDEDVEVGKVHKVDFEVNANDLTRDFVEALADYESECGNGIDFPLVLIREVVVEDLNIGRTNVVFKSGDIKFLKKFATKVMKDSFGEGVLLDVIGKCTVNTFDGAGQIEIVDLEFLC